MHHNTNCNFKCFHSFNLDVNLFYIFSTDVPLDVKVGDRVGFTQPDDEYVIPIKYRDNNVYPNCKMVCCNAMIKS